MSLHTRSKFMLFIAIVFFIYSILWGVAPYATINLPARFILDIADWPLDNLSTPLDHSTQWLSAIGAGLLAAVSIFLGGIVAPAIREKNLRVARMTIIAMSVWYFIDSAGSIAAGVGTNVFFNTVYLVLVIIPLLGIKKAE